MRHIFGRLLCFMLLFAGTLGAVDTTSEWDHWGADLENTRHVVSTIGVANVATLNLVCNISDTVGNVYAGASVQQGRAYIADDEGFVYCFSLVDCSLVWRTNLTAAFNFNFTAASRSTPALASNHDSLVVSDLNNARVYALRKSSGAPLWQNNIEVHPDAIITMSGTIYRGLFLIGVSSTESETTAECCNFRGSMVALVMETGVIFWKRYTMPDNQGSYHSYAGGAVWGSSPAIDTKNSAVIYATGNAYRYPQSVYDCIARSGSAEHCTSKHDWHESFISLRLRDGKLRDIARIGIEDHPWDFSCTDFGIYGQPPGYGNGYCPPDHGVDADFGQGVMIVKPSGSGRTLLIAGEKNGKVTAVDARSFQIVWQITVGPQSLTGGMMFGSTTDQELVFVASNNFGLKEQTLLNGTVYCGALWIGIQARTGRVLWQTPVPNYPNLTQCAAYRANAPDNTGTTYQYFTHKHGFIHGALSSSTNAAGETLVYSGDMGGTTYVLNGSTGQILWQQDTGGMLAAGTTVLRDGILVSVGYRVGLYSGPPGKGLLYYRLASAITA